MQGRSEARPQGELQLPVCKRHSTADCGLAGKGCGRGSEEPAAGPLARGQLLAGVPVTCVCAHCLGRCCSAGPAGLSLLPVPWRASTPSTAISWCRSASRSVAPACVAQLTTILACANRIAALLQREGLGLCKRKFVILPLSGQCLLWLLQSLLQWSAYLHLCKLLPALCVHISSWCVVNLCARRALLAWCL